MSGEMSVEEYRDKKVVVLGLGRQGMAMARFFARAGARVVVSDRRTEDALRQRVDALAPLGVEFVLGGHPLSLLDDAAMLALSGGVPLTLPVVQEATRRGIPLVSDAELTLKHSPVPVIGITGSAGKTTTTTLVGEILRLGGKRVHVGGNIGTPVLDRLDELKGDDWLVLELSSFQLELCTRSPRVATVLNVTPNHLDRHPSMEAYAEAKRNILRYQKSGDTVVWNLDNPWTARWREEARAGRFVGVRHMAFSLKKHPYSGTFLDRDRLMAYVPEMGRPSLICRVDEIKLRGRHNVANVLAATVIGMAVGVHYEVAAEVARTFEGVPHRLEVVRRWQGALWVNDSIATAPERVVAALRSFESPVVLLAGGRDKKLPWDEFAREAAKRARWVIAFGEAAPLIEEVLQPFVGTKEGLLAGVERVSTLEEAVHRAAQRVLPGDVVLLSPGGTSFDAYENFEERGEHFRALVHALGDA